MKTRMHRVVFPFLIWTLFICTALAQGPGFFPWWDGPIVRDLGLSEDQNRQIRTTVRDWRDRVIQLRGAVESAEAALKDEMDADQVDERRAKEGIEKVIATRAELTRAVSQMSLKLRLVLTPAQWQELQKRQPRPPGPRLMQGDPRMGEPDHREGPRRPPQRPPELDYN